MTLLTPRHLGASGICSESENEKDVDNKGRRQDHRYSISLTLKPVAETVTILRAAQKLL